MRQPGFIRDAREELKDSQLNSQELGKRPSTSHLSMLEEHRYFANRLMALLGRHSLTLLGNFWTDGISNSDEGVIKGLIDDAWAKGSAECCDVLKEYRQALETRLKGGSCCSKHTHRVAVHMTGKPGRAGEGEAPRNPVTRDASPLNQKIGDRSRIERDHPFGLHLNGNDRSFTNDLDIYGNENWLEVNGRNNRLQVRGNRNTINVLASGPRYISRSQGDPLPGAQGVVTGEILGDSFALNASRTQDASTFNNSQPETLLLENNRASRNR